MSLWFKFVHENPHSSCFPYLFFPFPFFSLHSLLLAKKTNLHCKHSLCNSCPTIKRETGFLAGCPNSNPVALASLERERERRGGREERDCEGCSSLPKCFQLRFSSRKFQLNLIITSCNSLCHSALLLSNSQICLVQLEPGSETVCVYWMCVDCLPAPGFSGVQQKSVYLIVGQIKQSTTD